MASRLKPYSSSAFFTSAAHSVSDNRLTTTG